MVLCREKVVVELYSPNRFNAVVVSLKSIEIISEFPLFCLYGTFGLSLRRNRVPFTM